MARKGNSSRSIPRRKGKIKWESSARKESERMVIEGLIEGTNRTVDRNAKKLESLQSDQSKSKCRKDGDDVVGIGMGKEESDRLDVPINFGVHFEKALDDGSLIKKDRLQTLEEERGKIYGDTFLSHQAIGLVWEGIFRNRYHEYLGHLQGIGKLFPADLVAEMLAGFKLARLSRPIYKQDSADDIHNYVSFSERFRGEKK